MNASRLLLLLSLCACRAVLELPEPEPAAAAPPEADAAGGPADGGDAGAPPRDAAVTRDLARPPADLAPACPPSGPQDCSRGPGSGEPDTCAKLMSCFFPKVRDAVTQVIADHPDWFDMSSGSPLVLKPEDYMNAVVAVVRGKGLCAIRDPNARTEIAVKHDNRWAESFNILASSGLARWGSGIYTATCAPAWF